MKNIALIPALIVGILAIVFIMPGCEEPSQRNKRSQAKISTPADDLTLNAVVHYADDEEKVDAVNRYLWNLMTNERTRYRFQLRAVKVWLLLNKHIECNPLLSEESDE